MLDGNLSKIFGIDLLLSDLFRYTRLSVSPTSYAFKSLQHALPIIGTIAQTTETRNFACANFWNLLKNNHPLSLPKLAKI